jgi:hypothetical protein
MGCVFPERGKGTGEQRTKLLDTVSINQTHFCEMALA